MTETDGTLDPDILRVGAPESHRLRQSAQQVFVHGRTVEAGDADDTAHGDFAWPETTGRSKGRY